MLAHHIQILKISIYESRRIFLYSFILQKFVHVYQRRHVLLRCLLSVEHLEFFHSDFFSNHIIRICRHHSLGSTSPHHHLLKAMIMLKIFKFILIQFKFFLSLDFIKIYFELFSKFIAKLGNILIFIYQVINKKLSS